MDQSQALNRQILSRIGKLINANHAYMPGLVVHMFELIFPYTFFSLAFRRERGTLVALALKPTTKTPNGVGDTQNGLFTE